MSLRKYFDFIDEIWCINLDERSDRWSRAQLQFEKLGIKDRVQRFSAIKHDNPKFGLVQSFLSLIKYAKSKKLSNILIFEDDILFSPTELTEPTLDAAMNQLQLHSDWGMLFYGAMLTQEVYYEEPNLIRLVGGLCAHAICYKNTVFDDLIKNLSELDNVRHEQDAYDWYTLRLQHIHKTYLIAPMIAHQEPSYSDLEKRYVDKDNTIDSLFRTHTADRVAVGYPPGHIRSDFTTDIVTFLTSSNEIPSIKLQAKSMSYMKQNSIRNIFVYYTSSISSKDRESIYNEYDIDIAKKVKFVNLDYVCPYTNELALNVMKLQVASYIRSEVYIILPVSHIFISETSINDFIHNNKIVCNGTFDCDSEMYNKCLNVLNTANVFKNDYLPDVSKHFVFYTNNVKSFLISLKENPQKYFIENDIDPLYLYIANETKNDPCAFEINDNIIVSLDRKVLKEQLNIIENQKDLDYFHKRNAYKLADISSIDIDEFLKS